MIGRGGLSALVAVTVCAGCPGPVEPEAPRSAAPRPSAPKPPPSQSPLSTWSLKGKVPPDPGPSTPPPFEGAREMLGEDCGAAAALTGGAGAPCYAEYWSGEAGEEAWFVRAGGRAVLKTADAASPATVRWQRLGPPLADCLGDPLQPFPAGDLQAWRSMGHHGEGLRWEIHLSGENRCGLRGTLLLDVHGQGLDPSGLTVGGDPWFKGGASQASGALMREIRGRALGEWSELDDADRIAIIEALSRDPDPEAGALLRALAARHPRWEPDVARALERRATAGAATEESTKEDQ